MMRPTILLFWQRYGLTAMLGLAFAGFLGAIGVETNWGQALRLPLPATTNTPRTTDMLATLPGFSLPSLDTAFKETADRPLFTPTRRPSAFSLAGNVPAMKKGQFRLSGTSVNNDLTVAFLLETATGKTVRITKGKDINGITLDTVEANRVILKQGEETEELTLRTAPSPPPPPNVPPPPTPGAAPVAPGAPASVPPVAVVNATPAPQPAARPVPPPQNLQNAQNPFVPAPGYSQLPGFVMPSAVVLPPTQATPPVDKNSPAKSPK